MVNAAEMIQHLEQELKATQQRCVLLERALGCLRDIYGQTPLSGRRARVERRAATPATRATQKPGTRSSAVEARDAAIRERLKQGPADTAELRATLPPELGETSDNRETNCRNALSRMRLRGEIQFTTDGRWALR